MITKDSSNIVMCWFFLDAMIFCNKFMALWRTKKSHFQPSVEMGMKNVDKNIDKRNKQWFGSETRHNAMTMDIRVDWVAWKNTKIIACCSYRCSNLRFSCPFRPRAESATFGSLHWSVLEGLCTFRVFRHAESTVTPQWLHSDSTWAGSGSMDQFWVVCR